MHGRETSDVLVWVDRRDGPRPSDVVDEVLRRLGVPEADVYRTWRGGFGARLDPAAAAALVADPDVVRVVGDEPGRPSPYWPNTSPKRVPGSYLVMMRTRADAVALTRRLGLPPTTLYRLVLIGFAAVLTDAQRELVRRSPGVDVVIDNAVHGV